MDLRIVSGVRMTRSSRRRSSASRAAARDGINGACLLAIVATIRVVPAPARPASRRPRVALFFALCHVPGGARLYLTIITLTSTASCLGADGGPMTRRTGSTWAPSHHRAAGRRSPPGGHWPSCDARPFVTGSPFYWATATLWIAPSDSGRVAHVVRRRRCVRPAVLGHGFRSDVHGCTGRLAQPRLDSSGDPAQRVHRLGGVGVTFVARSCTSVSTESSVFPVPYHLDLGSPSRLGPAAIS